MILSRPSSRHARPRLAPNESSYRHTTTRTVIAGQGTIALELHQQLRDIDAIFVAAGGGGLIGGIGAYMKAASPKTEIIGCWPENSPVLYRCLEAGRILNVPEQPTLSESTAGGLEPRSITIDLCRAVVDRAVLVSESEILAAMRRSLEEDHWLIEGAAGVALRLTSEKRNCMPTRPPSS
jgi:threonine dehydratase